MYTFAYPARFATVDGRILVQFVDLPRVATDGKNDSEAMEEATDALGSDLSIRLSRKREYSGTLRCEARPAFGVIQASLSALGKQMTLEARDAA